MIYEIYLENKKVEYSIRVSKRAKSLFLKIHESRGIEVVVPHRVKSRIDNTYIKRFIVDNSKWVLKNLITFDKLPSRIDLSLSREDYIRYKDFAYMVILQRLKYYNKFYQYRYKNVVIKNQKTAWGSCSSNKNLNFNFRLIFLPDRLLDYVVVHELCHLKEMNHGPRFWALVGKQIPDYIEAKDELKKYFIG